MSEAAGSEALAGSSRALAARCALLASALGFASSRGYPFVAASWDAASADLFVDASMVLSHLGFLTAAAVLVRSSSARGRAAGVVVTASAAALLAILTYVWVP